MRMITREIDDSYNDDDNTCLPIIVGSLILSCLKAPLSMDGMGWDGPPSRVAHVIRRCREKIV